MNDRFDSNEIADIQRTAWEVWRRDLLLSDPLELAEAVCDWDCALERLLRALIATPDADLPGDRLIEKLNGIEEVRDALIEDVIRYERDVECRWEGFGDD